MRFGFGAILLIVIIFTAAAIALGIKDFGAQIPSSSDAGGLLKQGQQEKCIYCGDTGCVADAHDCELCKQTGAIKCPTCGGSKWYINSKWKCDNPPNCSDPDPWGEPRQLQCTACDDNGNVVCPKCGGNTYWVSYIDCQFCGKKCQSASS